MRELPCAGRVIGHRILADGVWSRAALLFWSLKAVALLFRLIMSIAWSEGISHFQQTLIVAHPASGGG